MSSPGAAHGGTEDGVDGAAIAAREGAASADPPPSRPSDSEGDSDETEGNDEFKELLSLEHAADDLGACPSLQQVCCCSGVCARCGRSRGAAMKRRHSDMSPAAVLAATEARGGPAAGVAAYDSDDGEAAGSDCRGRCMDCAMWLDRSFCPGTRTALPLVALVLVCAVAFTSLTVASFSWGQGSALLFRGIQWAFATGYATFLSYYLNRKSHPDAMEAETWRAWAVGMSLLTGLSRGITQALTAPPEPWYHKDPEHNTLLFRLLHNGTIALYFACTYVVPTMQHTRSCWCARGPRVLGCRTRDAGGGDGGPRAAHSVSVAAAAGGRAGAHAATDKAPPRTPWAMRCMSVCVVLYGFTAVCLNVWGIDIVRYGAATVFVWLVCLFVDRKAASRDWGYTICLVFFFNAVPQGAAGLLINTTLRFRDSQVGQFLAMLFFQFMLSLLYRAWRGTAARAAGSYEDAVSANHLLLWFAELLISLSFFNLEPLKFAFWAILSLNMLRSLTFYTFLQWDLVRCVQHRSCKWPPVRPPAHARAAWHRAEQALFADVAGGVVAIVALLVELTMWRLGIGQRIMTLGVREEDLPLMMGGLSLVVASHFVAVFVVRRVHGIKLRAVREAYGAKHARRLKRHSSRVSMANPMVAAGLMGREAEAGAKATPTAAATAAAFGRMRAADRAAGRDSARTSATTLSRASTSSQRRLSVLSAGWSLDVSLSAFWARYQNDCFVFLPYGILTALEQVGHLKLQDYYVGLNQ